MDQSAEYKAMKDATRAYNRMRYAEDKEYRDRLKKTMRERYQRKTKNCEICNKRKPKDSELCQHCVSNNLAKIKNSEEFKQILKQMLEKS